MPSSVLTLMGIDPAMARSWHSAPSDGEEPPAGPSPLPPCGMPDSCSRCSGWPLVLPSVGPCWSPACRSLWRLPAPTPDPTLRSLLELGLSDPPGRLVIPWDTPFCARLGSPCPVAWSRIAHTTGVPAWCSSRRFGWTNRSSCVLEDLRKQLAVLGFAECNLFLGQHFEGHHANFHHSVGCFLLVLVLAKLLQLLTHRHVRHVEWLGTDGTVWETRDYGSTCQAAVRLWGDPHTTPERHRWLHHCLGFQILLPSLGIEYQLRPSVTNCWLCFCLTPVGMWVRSGRISVPAAHLQGFATADICPWEKDSCWIDEFEVLCSKFDSKGFPFRYQSLLWFPWEMNLTTRMGSFLEQSLFETSPFQVAAKAHDGWWESADCQTGT